MKKILITSLASILGTMAVTGGAVAVLSKMPNKLNISWGKQESQSRPQDLEKIEELNNIIKSNEETIKILNEYNFSANSTITALEMEIEELNALLSSDSTKFSVPEDIKLTGGSVIDLDENTMYVSSTNHNGSKGLYKVDKATNEWISLCNLGYNYSTLYSLQNNKFALVGNGCIVIIDNETGLVDFSFETNSTQTKVIKFDNYVCFGSSSVSNSLYIYNTLTKEYVKSNSSSCDIRYGFGFYNNYLLLYQSSGYMKVDLSTGVCETVTNSFGGLIYTLDNGEIVMISVNSSKGFAKFNKETETFDILSSDISFGSISSIVVYNIGNGKYLISGGKSIYYDSLSGTVSHLMKNETTNLGTFKILKVLDSSVIIDSGRRIYQLNIETLALEEITSYTNGTIACSLELASGNFIISTSDSTYFYVDMSKKSCSMMYFSTGYKFTQSELIGEGLYKLTTEDGKTSVMFNEADKLIYNIDIVIE